MRHLESSRPWWLLPSGRIHPAWWLAVAPVLIGLDYAAGPDTQFPLLYVVPVCVAAWYSGQRAAVMLAIAVPLAHLTFTLTLWGPPADLGRIVGTTTIRAAVVAFVALVFARQSEHERELRRDLERRHALELQAEQIRVVHVTMRTVLDIVNNCLNQLQLLRHDAEGVVPAESLSLFDKAIQDASTQLKALADLEAYAERQMEIGAGLDIRKIGSTRH